jgi:predicted CXXCH cytochrome family protein
MTTERKFSALVLVLAAAASFPWVWNQIILGSGFNRPGASDMPVQSSDYSQFKHENPQHARLPCLLCHRRETNSSQPSLPGKSNHAPCSGCHAQQFSDSSSQLCAICHTNSQTGAMKTFPSLKSFNVKFDHARHLSGGTKCASCHRPNRAGIALSIPAGPSGHTICFRCHTPDAKPNESNLRNLGSCSTCHELGHHVWSTERASAFRLSFSHRSHDTSENLICSACHRVMSGQPIGRQVTSPVALNHHAPARALSCMTCHNGKRAFGGDDFSVCTRCHKGSSWRF